jgi:hypothetical protein
MNNSLGMNSKSKRIQIGNENSWPAKRRIYSNLFKFEFTQFEFK